MVFRLDRRRFDKKNADQIRVETTTSHRPVKPQYTLSKEAMEGIKPVIAIWNKQEF